jgi:drug/metabolite transporter (DMT)-like permease
VLTYFALRDGSPALYNAVLRGNVLLIALAETLRNKKSSIPRWPMAIMILGYSLLILAHGFSDGFKMSLGVLTAFFIYTVASTRFQRQEKVLARYPQFFFYTTGIALLMGIVLTGWSHLLLLPIRTVIGIAAYTACFIGMPYILFYWLTKKYGYVVVSPWIALSLIVTMVGQMVLYGFSSIMLIVLPALLLILGSLFSSKKMDSDGEN